MTTASLSQCRRLAHHARWRTPDPRSYRRGASSRRSLNRVVVVAADGRFRDEAERRAAIDRLSPPSTSRSTDDGGDARDDDARDPAKAPRVPPPKITRDADRTRPRRFKDALDADRRRKGGAVGRTARMPANDEDPPADVDREALARELRERRRERRVAAVESEAADRLASIVQIVRAELGDPRVLISSSMDGEARNKRFAALYERLEGVGTVEIAFALVKYYWTYWDEAEAGETSEKAAFAAELGDSKSTSEEENDTSTSSSENKENEDDEEDRSTYDEAVDEKTRRALLRAAQLRATQRGDEVRTSSSYYSGDEDFGDEKSAPGDGNKGADDDEYGLMDAVADMVRSYFSVDVVKDEDGNEEMVVMTSPEFLGFLIVAVIVSSRLGRYLVDTYLATPVDPLLR
ncbi:predicted protein [Micromonas commoda]|uniref:Uncharacterized protein n=1 Tax=Micromonas commoda (strain RCC299 / NOUM17 / CCMP2709) TaxID=296587 RepID=C1EHY0_MICCC|nr:predicted protein [Micromonas commoda]ACO67587.1 predicted protein [Micromonas commoda]|eukprot:XP_002506329.1 predicted protein [Micromonas commoda]